MIYFISAFGTKEKSFEEALEEQKRRSLEEELQQKQEKGRKDREKKFKKWNKRKEKTEMQDSEKVEIPVHDSQTNELVGEIEIVEPREILQRRKVKASYKGNATKLDSSPLDEVEMLENLAKPSGDAKAVNGEKRKTEKLPVKEKDVVRVDVREKEAVKIKVSEPQVPAPVNDDSVLVLPEASPVTPSKKKKKEGSDKNIDLAGFTVSRLLQFLKEAELGDEESQMLIDVLLNKQKGASEWKKKNDPLATVKKQLQEKEQAFEVEASQRQAATAKLKELKQEYAQEKTRASTQERLLQDKVNQQFQENKMLTQRIKQIQEQFNVERTSYQEQIHQLQSTFDEKHESVVKVLQEEKTQLQKTVTKLETSVLSKASASDYETKLGSLQTSRDDLQKVHNILVEQHTLLISSHKNEMDKLKAQLSEAERMVNEANDTQRSLIEEVEILRKSHENLEASKCSIEQQLSIARSDKREFETLQIQLEEAQGKYRNLEAQMFHLSDRVAELNQQNSSQLSQLQCLQQENERLSVELKSALTSDVKTIAHQNGDITEKENELQKSVAEKEIILEEKEKQLQQVHEELQKQRKQVTALTHDLEVQKQKNNELREKNWKAMDALSNAEKSAEQKVQDAQRIASEKMLQAQQEVEKQLRLAGEKNSLEKSCEKLKHEVQVAEKNLLCYQNEVKERLQVCQTEFEEQIKHLNFELQTAQDKLKLAQNRISDNESAVEDLKQDYAKTENSTKKSLQRIFSDVNIDSSLPYSIWLSQFEEQALAVLKTSVTQKNKVDELLTKLADTEHEKEELIKAVQNYKTVLADTESLLNRLQHSAESAELVWKDKLNKKEQELISAIKEKEDLISEKEKLQSTIDHMGRLDEMQEKLKLLQNTIETAESERAHLQLKYEEVNNNYVNLQGLIKDKEQKIIELQKNLVILDDTLKELREVKSKLEKETKINKDLSAQTVKLNSLVKIGQDSLKAEQDLVNQLRSELEAHKNCPTTANGTSSPSLAVTENEDSGFKK